MSMKTMVCLGTRPEAVKLCPLILELRKRGVPCVVYQSGQHEKITDDALHAFGVTADFRGSVPAGGDLTARTVALLGGIREALKSTRADCIFVQGDTATAFCGALAGFYAGVPVMHLEAGLRSGDMQAPYPEEFYRRTIDSIAALCFAPTAIAAGHLWHEEIPRKRIFVVGNTVTDALRFFLGENRKKSTGGDKLIVFTAHRREALDSSMKKAFESMRAFLKKHPHVGAIFPVHPNPAVVQLAEKTFADCYNIQLSPPIDVETFYRLLQQATVLVTDSGGLQEEASWLGIPTLVLRDRTERVEGVANGGLVLVGADGRRLFEMLENIFSRPSAAARLSHPSNVYGDGHVSAHIVDILLSSWENSI